MWDELHTADSHELQPRESDSLTLNFPVMSEFNSSEQICKCCFSNTSRNEKSQASKCTVTLQTNGQCQGVEVGYGKQEDQISGVAVPVDLFFFVYWL